MGFFKSIGKIAKGLSLKNVIKVATGSGGEVATEFLNRAKKAGGEIASGKRSTLQRAVDGGVIGAMTGISSVSKNELTGAIAKGLGTGQTLDALNNGLIKIGPKAWFLANFKKYKIYFIGGAVALVGAIVYFSTRKKPNTFKAKYRK